MTVSKKSSFKQLSTTLGFILFFILGFWLGTKYNKNQDSVTIVNSDQELEEFQSITGEFVRTWMDGDAEACANNFSEDAVYMVPGEPALFGRTAIRGSLEKLFDQRSNNFPRLGSDSVVVKEFYKWIVVAKRGDAGRWETVWDIYNLGH